MLVILSIKSLTTIEYIIYAYYRFYNKKYLHGALLLVQKILLIVSSRNVFRFDAYMEE